MNITILIILSYFLFSHSVFSSENAIFDQHRKTPEEIFLKLYKENRIIALASSGHSSSKIFDFLARTLNTIKDDPQLKFIVLESFGDNDLFYKLLSQKSLEDVLEQGPFPTAESQDNSLCGGSQFSYTIANLFPKIRKINEQRPSRPLLVSPVDGAISIHDVFWPHIPGPIYDGNCHIENGLPIYSASGDREIDTSYNFQSRIWNQLGAHGKAIVVYHYAHLIHGFTSCFPFLENQTWKARWTHLTWLSHFLERVPVAKNNTAIILLDEIDTSQSPNGAFKFSQRQSARYPKQSFAVELKHFSEVFKEKGLEVFDSEAMLHTYQGGNHVSHKTLDDMATALIWNWDSHLNYSYKSPHYYLPKHCKDLTQ